jgi:hypothetical protein
METITLHVDEASAKAWNNSPPLLRAAYEEKISAILKEMSQPEVIGEPEFTKEQLQFLKEEAMEDTGRYEWWKDEELMAELDKEAEDFENGKIEGFTLEESMVRLRDKSLRSE